MLGSIEGVHPSSSASSRATLSLAYLARPIALSNVATLVLATLAAAAGVIHLVMVPAHSGESTSEGILFALSGWSQLLLALFIVRRPSALLLLAGIALSAGLIAAWAMSRTVGHPF